MSIGSEETSSDSNQARPGPAAAGSDPSAVPSSNNEPRTPSPPPQKAQTLQQQTQQHQPQPTSISQPQQHAPENVKDSMASTAKVALPAPATTSQPPPRPPPPASAVSLHAAAAAAANKDAAGSASKPAAPIAQTASPISSSAPAGPSAAASTNKVDANRPTKKAGRVKAPKPPGVPKQKQKRRANQAGGQDDLVYRPGPSTAGGTIGAAPDATIPAMLTAAGGGRKALPELVLPFQLPFVDVRPELPMLDNASVQAAMAMGASETSSPDTGSDSEDYSVISDDSDLDSEAEESRRQARRRRKEPATIEESLVLLQSLRQSRLSHLSSLLTPFSQRVRSGMIYPNVLPLSLLHGLNPRDPHVLIQLGRADIHVGPHVFMKTKFWEVRPDYELPISMNPINRMRAPGSFGGPPDFARMPTVQPLPQQLPQPQPHQLPSPRPPPSLPQPSVPVPRPATTASKPTATSASSSQISSKPAVAPSPAALPTQTLPATPVPSPAPARPSGPPKAAPATPASTAITTPVPAPASAAASASTSTGVTATLAAAPTTIPAPAVTPASTPSTTTVKPAIPATSAASATTSTNEESKSTSVPLVPKPISTVPVSLPRPPMTTPSLPRPPSINQNNIPSSANSTAPNTGSAGAAAAQVKPTGTVTVAGASTNAGTTGATPAATAGPIAASTSASSQVSSAPNPPANTATTAGGSQAPVRPPGPPPPPAIDAVLVSRVNATAALNPELQELLHIAASGKANPNQLKALGVWIQAITAQLRQDEARNAAAANNAAGASGSRAGNAASTTAEGKKSKKNKVDEAAKASKKQAKIEEREAKKKAKAEAKAKAQADKQQQQKHHKEKHQTQQQPVSQHQQQQATPSNKLRHPPPGWPTDGPPKPPVIIVEFRENPSMRFILPLWKCLVERTEGVERPSLPKVEKERRSFFDNDSDDEESQRIEPELKLSFFAPSLGSDAADGSGLRELEEELKRKAAEEAKLTAATAPSPPSQSNGAADGTPSATASPEAVPSANNKNDDTSATGGKRKKGGANASSKKSGNKTLKQDPLDSNLSSGYQQSKKHEVYPLTWSIKGGVTESLWEAFGRVPGTMTLQPVKREPQIELEPDVAEFLVPEIRYHLLDLPMEEIKIQKETTETFVDLYSQMPDRRFILPRVAPALLPQGLEDHLQDRFAVRPQCIQGRPMVKRKAGAREDDVSFSYEGIGLTVIGPNGVKTEPGADPPKPPKRKRHVATHNPDGTIKSCGACGKTKTPMWRRGPKGPSQLCNACGARWKAGRLVVPEVAPPPIIEAEEDKSKDEEVHKEDEAKASSMHGSNALVIPQSSSADDGSYTVMASTGLTGPAAFGDHGAGGMFSMASEGKDELDYLSRGSTSPSPFIRSPVPEEYVMPASVDPSMLSGSIRTSSSRR